MHHFAKRPLIFFAIFFLCAGGSSAIRSKLTDDKKEIEVIEEKPAFPGYFYRPAKGGPFPAILFLHGSDGGNGDYWRFPGEHLAEVGRNAHAPALARKYAQRGFVTYALCYFDCAHHEGFKSYPPKELSRVAIDGITGRAVQWLRSHPSVASRKVGLLGMSRGAEQALLLASLCSGASCPDVTVALSPSDFAEGEFSKDVANQIERGEKPRWIDNPAWTFSGRPISVRTPIPFERYAKPWLISFFTQDSAWSDTVDPEKLLKRLKRMGVPFEITDLEKNSAMLARPAKSKGVVLRFRFSGHVSPSKTKAPNSRDFQDKKVFDFFRETLR